MNSIQTINPLLPDYRFLLGKLSCIENLVEESTNKDKAIILSYLERIKQSTLQDSWGKKISSRKLKVLNSLIKKFYPPLEETYILALVKSALNQLNYLKQLSQINRLNKDRIPLNSLGLSLEECTGLLKQLGHLLNYLEIIKTPFKDLQRILPLCSNLSTLHLQNCAIHPEHLKVLPDFPQLVCLDLSGNQIDEEGLAIILQKFPHLQVLDLKENPIASIQGLKNTSDLEELYLSFTYLEHHRIIDLPQVKLQNLRILDLSYNFIENIAYVLSQCSLNLEGLFIAGNDLTSEDAKYLIKLNQDELTLLDVSHNQLGDEGFKILSEGFVSLQDFDASYNNLTNAALTALEHLSTLQTLQLDGNEIDDEGITELINYLPNLEDLSIKNNSIGAIGEARLKEKFNMNITDMTV
ncbi:MAG: hypothetical protein BGO14_07920 [Chlamydiales bacterium 38-26]|nr:hypothetical protein [Chlamydiales bacterium]OJV10921.1 MAG: hypothetical protein BGO14_07920 [Chlamydiales bacterium 38-26]